MDFSIFKIPYLIMDFSIFKIPYLNIMTDKKQHNKHKGHTKHKQHSKDKQHKEQHKKQHTNGKYLPTIVTISYIDNEIQVSNIKTILQGKSPLSGNEPHYEPWKWNDKDYIKNFHNCYSYAFNDYQGRRTGKAQPGYFAHYPPINNTEYNCDDIYKRIKKDNPSIRKTNFNNKCPKGSYKAFFALDPEGDTDYHFYRQDSNGYWSHKPGRSNVVNTDAKKKKIRNPKLADRNYGTYNYKNPCNYFCLRPDMTRTHSTSAHNK